jgi:hypothetical protein
LNTNRDCFDALAAALPGGWSTAAAEDRLDKVVGPTEWHAHYAEVAGVPVCDLTIKVPGGPQITKTGDGYMTAGDPPNPFEVAFRRACGRFGIGRNNAVAWRPPSPEAGSAPTPGPEPEPEPAAERDAATVEAQGRPVEPFNGASMVRWAEWAAAKSGRRVKEGLVKQAAKEGHTGPLETVPNAMVKGLVDYARMVLGEGY